MQSNSFVLLLLGFEDHLSGKPEADSSCAATTVAMLMEVVPMDKIAAECRIQAVEIACSQHLVSVWRIEGIAVDE